jgi:L-2-hydroxyglutarate oxidase LhgO
MTERLDCAVIGGGVVGLAIARKLAMLGRQVVLFEAEKTTGQHTSSRNSEVIHAGIYYPTGTLKAQLCAGSLLHPTRYRLAAHRQAGGRGSR